MTSKIRPDKETLTLLYLEKNLTQTEIGLRYGVTGQCVSGWCVKFGLSKKGGKATAPAEAIVPEEVTVPEEDTRPLPIPSGPSREPWAFRPVASYPPVSSDLGLPVKPSLGSALGVPKPRVTLQKGTVAIYLDTDRIGITRFFTVEEGKLVDEATISGARILEAFRHPGLRRLVLKIEVA